MDALLLTELAINNSINDSTRLLPENVIYGYYFRMVFYMLGTIHTPVSA